MSVGSIYGPSIDFGVENAKLSLPYWMRDTVTIKRMGPSTFDPDLGTQAPGSPMVIWSGIARVTPANSSSGQLGDELFTYWTTTIYIPWNDQTTEMPRANDVVVVDTAYNDHSLVGRIWRVLDVSTATHAVSRAMTCTTFQESGEWS